MITGCKCCGRDDRHAADCLIPENAQLRARIAELEGLLVTQTVDDVANIIDADGAQKARSESLAAERDAALLTADCAKSERDLAWQSCQKARAERDRYLAAIRQRADAKTIGEMSAADIALRRIAEEAK